MDPESALDGRDPSGCVIDNIYDFKLVQQLELALKLGADFELF